MKKRLKTILALILALSLLAALPVFAASQQSANAADALNTLGLFQGTGKGYELDRAPTRAESLVMLIRLLGKESEAQAFTGSCPLTDVAGRWMAPYVGWAYANGIAKGVSDIAFDPDSTASAKMYATFMLRALGYSEDRGQFSYKTAVEDASKLGISPAEGYNGEFTRGDAVVMSYNALTAACADGESTLLEQLIGKGIIDPAVAASLGFDVQLPEARDWAPDIRFTTLDEKGNSWDDSCFRSAKLTMINYWAYWCGPCTREMPDLQKLQEDYRDRGLQILGISDTEYEEDNIDVMEELGITYPCLRYTEAFDPYLMTGYIPDTMFVDSEGRVLGEVLIGSRSYEDWAEIIESYLLDGAGSESASGRDPADGSEDWSPDIRFSTKDEKGNTWSDECFRDAELTMINYWAYWCGPCTNEMPDLQRLLEDYGDRGFRILGISDAEFEEDNIDVMKELGITYPCLRYTSAFDPYLMTGYIPDTIFVDSEGHVLGEVLIGSRSYEDWAEIIESYLP